MDELTSKIESYEQELEQFNLVKSDWQMEKQSLEGTLLRLRQELRIKDEALCVAQARKVSAPCGLGWACKGKLS